MSDRRSVNHGSVRPASLATPAGGDGCQWILASSSPRRRALLRLLGHPFRVIVPAIDETPQAGERPAAFARRAAMEKALAVAERLPPLRGARWRIVIACDTIVVLGHRILGKPRDAEDARRMLRVGHVRRCVWSKRPSSFEIFQRRKLSGMSPLASRWIRPAPTRSRGGRRRWCERFAAPGQMSSACRWLSSPTCSPDCRVADSAVR